MLLDILTSVIGPPEHLGRVYTTKYVVMDLMLLWSLVATSIPFICYV